MSGNAAYPGVVHHYRSINKLENLCKAEGRSTPDESHVCCEECLRMLGRLPARAQENPVAIRYEAVNHPKHYNEHPSGIECIDVIEHMTFNVGSAVKYLWRAGLKPGEATERDLRKAIWYIEREIEKTKKGTGKTDGK